MQKQPPEVLYKKAVVEKIAILTENTSVGVPFSFEILRNLSEQLL